MRRRLPRQVWPTAIAREYAAAILAQVRAAQDALEPLLLELPALLLEAARERGDGFRADVGPGRRVRELIERAAARIAVTARPAEVEQVAAEFARRTESYQRVQLGRQVRAALGADVFATERQTAVLVDGFVAENVSLIRSIAPQVIAEVEQAVTRAVANGTPHRKLAREIEERFAVAQARAKVIARDQVGKLYGQVNAARQREMGVERFVWRTVQDRRVRRRHRELEGEVFRYPKGHPTEGLPGTPILCRCSAEPVFDDLIGTGDSAGTPRAAQARPSGDRPRRR